MASRYSHQAEIQHIQSLITNLQAHLEVVSEEALAALSPELNRLLPFLNQGRTAEKPPLDPLAEKHYRQLVDILPDPIFVQCGGCFVFINDAGARLLGAETPDAIIGRRVLDHIVPEHKSLAEERMQMICEGQRQVGLTEETFLRLDGTRVDVEAIAVPYDCNGRPGALGILRDLTQRKLAEQAAQESRKEITEILDSINDGFFAFDRNWNYTYINHQAAEPLGMTPEALIGKNLWEVFPKMRGTIAEEHYRLAMEQGIQSQYRVQGVYSQRWYDVRVYPSRQGISVITLDRTEQIEAEQALRKSEERFRVALFNSPVAVFSTDRDLRYNWFYNPQMGSMQSLIIGKRDDEILPAANVTELMEIKRRALESRVPIQKEIQFQVFSDQKVMIASIEPYFGPNGEPEGVIGSLFDITEQRRLEAENIEHVTQAEVQRRLLEYREKERQEIARDLHDGPVQDLSSLIFNIQFTKEAVEDSGILVELEEINRGLKSVVHDLRGMINELRPPSLIRFGLSKAIRMYLDEFQEKHADIDIDINLADDENLLSEQLRLTLFRILQEALNNTAKHANAERISVEFQCSPDESQLEIRDNGKGFTLSSQLVDYTLKGHFGLVGMKERAEAVGGTCSILSTPGSGTLVRVTVPLRTGKKSG